ncbi:branched-chain amino acid ABC transporter permease [Lacisediminimonas profundi]|uniref:branched-chain amino acid ABC transporter permease n=1 Tax=Lacisediminimonas profundi TaxID=2603856 RepID=UPI00124B6C3B|nr:branched-chain amino acid ABC transporter permease [Lacisediminimonas profundi]
MASTLLQALLSGIAAGAVYGLIALGLSLQFGVMKIINFAHGSFLMMAMYVSFALGTKLGLHPLATAPLCAAVLFVVGYACQRWLIDDIYRKEIARESIGVLIFTTGLWIFLDHAFLALVGPDSRSLDSPWSNGVLAYGDLVFTYPQVAGLVVSVALTVALVAFLRFTAAGRAIRATGQDREAAGVLGIDSSHVYRMSFAIGLGVLGVAGALLLSLYPVNPFVGDVFGLRAFVIVVLGGIGSVGGAFLGGIIVGVLESVGSQLIPVTWAEALIFLLFLGVMYFRPNGLLGIESE